MKKRLLTLGCVILTCIYSFAQQANGNNENDAETVLCMLNEGDNLWIGTKGGLVKLNKTTGERLFFDQSDGLPQTTVAALAMNEHGEIWASSKECIIAKFNGTGFETLKPIVSPTPQNYALTVDKNNKLWYGALAAYTTGHETGEGEIQRWQLPPSRFSANSVSSHLWTTVNGEEILYIGGNIFMNYLLKFDGNNLTPILKGQIPSPVSKLLQGQEGGIWIATDSGGLLYYAADGTITSYNTSNSDLPANNIYDIQRDHEGNYWLACGCSLVKYDGQQFTTYPTDQIKDDGYNIITHVLPDTDGTIWIGTKRQGLFNFSQGEFTAVNIENPSSIPDSPITHSTDIDIQVTASTLLCTAPNAVKLEVYTMDAIKVGEAAFSNGQAVVKVSKAPAMYLYIVTYPDGCRESGKVRVSEE